MITTLTFIFAILFLITITRALLTVTGLLPIVRLIFKFVRSTIQTGCDIIKYFVKLSRKSYKYVDKKHKARLKRKAKLSEKQNNKFRKVEEGKIASNGNVYSYSFRKKNRS